MGPTNKLRVRLWCSDRVLLVKLHWSLVDLQCLFTWKLWSNPRRNPLVLPLSVGFLPVFFFGTDLIAGAFLMPVGAKIWKPLSNKGCEIAVWTSVLEFSNHVHHDPCTCLPEEQWSSLYLAPCTLSSGLHTRLVWLAENAFWNFLWISLPIILNPISSIFSLILLSLHEHVTWYYLQNSRLIIKKFTLLSGGGKCVSGFKKKRIFIVFMNTKIGS